jgi:hypothetical protein
MFQSPHQSQIAYKKERDEKLEKLISLEKPSLATMTRRKIEVA